MRIHQWHTGRASRLRRRWPVEWVGRCEGGWAGPSGFKVKIPSGFDLQFPIDFGILQDCENLYKEIYEKF
jgi:hypothetical protein